MIINDLKQILKVDAACIFIGKRSVKEHYFPFFNKKLFDDFFDKYGDKEIIEISIVPAGDRKLIKLRIDKFE